WLALSGFGAIWLPRALLGIALWPLIAGAVVAVGWWLGRIVHGARRATLNRAPSTMIGPPSGVSAVLAIIAAPVVLWGVLSAYGADKPAPDPRAPARVFLLADSSGDPAKQHVLAPQDLLTQLDEMARAVPP